MDLGYQKYTEYSTDEMIFVDSNIKFIIGFVTSPPLGLMTPLKEWAEQCQRGELPPTKETIALAVQVLGYIDTPDGSRYSLTSVEEIQNFIDETTEAFLCNILVSWLAIRGAKRLADKKKPMMYSGRSNGNAKAKSQIRLLSGS